MNNKFTWVFLVCFLLGSRSTGMAQEASPFCSPRTIEELLNHPRFPKATDANALYQRARRAEAANDFLEAGRFAALQAFAGAATFFSSVKEQWNQLGLAGPEGERSKHLFETIGLWSADVRSLFQHELCAFVAVVDVQAPGFEEESARALETTRDHLVAARRWLQSSIERARPDQPGVSRARTVLTRLDAVLALLGDAGSAPGPDALARAQKELDSLLDWLLGDGVGKRMQTPERRSGTRLQPLALFGEEPDLSAALPRLAEARGRRWAVLGEGGQVALGAQSGARQLLFLGTPGAMRSIDLGEGKDALSINEQALCYLGPEGRLLVCGMVQQKPAVLEIGVDGASRIADRPQRFLAGQDGVFAAVDAEGLLFGPIDAMQRAARQGSPAPGMPTEKVVFGEFQEARISRQGKHLLFTATVQGPAMNGVLGLWLVGSDGPTLVARSGDKSPGAPQFAGMSPCAVLPDGRALFRNMAGAPQFWLGRPGGIRALDASYHGLAAPLDSGSLLFSLGSGSHALLQPDGVETVLFAEDGLELELHPGGRVAAQGREGLFGGTLHELSPILAGGDPVQVAPGDVRKITRNGIRKAGVQAPGGQTWFNGRGEILLWLEFEPEEGVRERTSGLFLLTY